MAEIAKHDHCDTCCCQFDLPAKDGEPYQVCNYHLAKDKEIERLRADRDQLINWLNSFEYENDEVTVAQIRKALTSQTEDG